MTTFPAPHENSLVELMDEGERIFSGSLGGLGVRGILAEGDRLERERQDLSAGTRALAFERYRAFIASSEAGTDVAEKVDDAYSAAENVASLLPPLREKCSSFESEAAGLSERRKRVSVVLAKHTRLLEILELPQLVETCVRNGHYEEALELRQFAAKIDRKLGTIPLVSSVVKAVQGSLKVMLQSLLAQLRAPIQLPACLRVVGYLRRMDVFTETELRLRFLQARDAWLTGVLSSIPDGPDPHLHLSKTMDNTRVHLFDIVTQYRALFSDDDVMNISNYSSGDMLRNTAFGPYQGSSSHRVLFSAWLDRRIFIFLETLKLDLQRIAAASKQRTVGSSSNYGGIDSLLNQAMYFGQSFGRVGADFRLSLVPIFKETAIEIALGALQDADVKFAQDIEQLALKASVKSTVGQNENPELSSNGTGKAKMENDLINKTENISPPISLLEFQPLAELCNAILIAFNEIRLVTPLAIAPKMIFAIQTLLEAAAQTLTDRERRFAKNKSTTDTELFAFRRMVNAFVVDLLRHIDMVTKMVFSPALTSKILATNIKDLVDLSKTVSPENMLVLDLAAIIKILPEEFQLNLDKTASLAIAEIAADQMALHPQPKEHQQTPNITVQEGEPSSISIEEATPDSQHPNEYAVKQEKDETIGDIHDVAESPSPYVVDRVELIAKEIEESKISDVQ